MGTPKPYPSKCLVTESKKKQNKMLKYAELSSRDKAPKIVNEYDQEIPQSQTADKPVAS